MQKEMEKIFTSNYDWCGYFLSTFNFRRTFMKKTLSLVCLALLVPSLSYANDDSAAKINLVKQVYQEARNPERLSSDILKKYADPSFKKALNVADRAEEGCFDADPIWNSQDPDYQEKVRVSVLSNGKVRALLSGRHVDYSVSCSSGACKISDVGGWKKVLLQCR